MAKKTVGYTELEWACPNCGSANPGMKKTCQACGSPQPEGVQFTLGAQRDLIADETRQRAASAGADVHCPYCGSRNPAGATSCAQCGGDPAEGKARAAGAKLAAAEAAPAAWKCPACGAENESGRSVCSACGSQAKVANPAPRAQAAASAPVKPSAFRPWMALPILAFVLALCVGLGFLLFRTETQTGVVQSVQWQRVIYVQAQKEVTRQAWQDEVPNGAKVLSCSSEYRSRQENPAPNSKEVCATEYVDQGNGAAEVVETCYYEVYDDYCKYTALEWQNVRSEQAQGTDLQPSWPPLRLSAAEREGERAEDYLVFFRTDGAVLEYNPETEASFVQFAPNSVWNLSVNSFGSVVDVSP